MCLMVPRRVAVYTDESIESWLKVCGGAWRVRSDWVPDVIALVGASGTGKSYRASMVAADNKADAILDDGLLIADGKILAGQSAKRASSKLNAVRRAIFTDQRAAEDMIEAIDARAPRRILVLGTSKTMIRRICARLALPEPSRVIDIEEVASSAEIRYATWTRREMGKHVIPAPTLEVRKTFSGYLVDPLRMFRKDMAREQIIEKSVVRPTWSHLGHFTIDDTVFSSIVTHAALEADGIAAVRRVRIETWAEGIVLHIDVTVRYGKTPLPQRLRAAQSKVKMMIEHMTAQNVLAVHIVAKRLLLPESALEG